MLEVSEFAILYFCFFSVLGGALIVTFFVGFLELVTAAQFSIVRWVVSTACTPTPISVLGSGELRLRFRRPGRRYGTMITSERIHAGWLSIPIAFVKLGLLDEWRPHEDAAHVRLFRCRVGRYHDDVEPKI